MKSERRESGATLVITLVMLLALTMLVVSAIRSGGAHLRITGNMQAQAEATTAAQQAIEQVLSSDAIFKTPAGQTVTVGNYSVSVLTPVCKMKRAVENGGSGDPNPNMYQDGVIVNNDVVDTFWDVPVTVDDASVTGVKIEAHQGVRIRLPAVPSPC
jgi:Tfp pilus assembly protein PilX